MNVIYPKYHDIVIKSGDVILGTTSERVISTYTRTFTFIHSFMESTHLPIHLGPVRIDIVM